VLLASILFPLASLADVPHMVRNLNTQVVTQSSYPQFLGKLNGRTLFGARDATGAALWSTDGTSAATRLVKRLPGFGVFQSPGWLNLAVIGTRACFMASDINGGAEVWTTDGTSGGTRMLKDVVPGPYGGNTQLLGFFGGKLIFGETDASGNRQLFSTDCTAAGTRQITAFTGQSSGPLFEIIPAESKFYFVSLDDFYARTIWVSNGTRAGTHQIVTGLPQDSTGDYLALYNPHWFRRIGDHFLYMSDGLLWSLNLADDTVSAVVAPGGLAGFGPPQNVEWAEPVLMDGFILFLSDGVNPDIQELWRSDGTSAGTYSIARIANRMTDLNPIPWPLLRKVGDKAVFFANDGIHGPQLWGTDGSSANTAMLTNIAAPGSVGDTAITWITTVGGLFFFGSPVGATATAWPLWQTDGTPAGTRPVPGFPLTDRAGVGSTPITGNESTIFLATYSEATGGFSSLFKYEPLLPKVTPLRGGLNIDWTSGFMFDGAALYFGSTDAVFGDEPWVSDGTPAGTHRLADIYPQTTDAGSNPDDFANLGGRLAFAADDGVHGREIWLANGAQSGAWLLADVLSGSGSSNPNHLFAVNGALYFFATDSSGLSNFMLIPHIGAAPQTLARLVPPQIEGAGNCARSAPVLMNGRVYFSADDGVNGFELWSSNGTAAGTQPVADINPGWLPSNPCQLTVVGNRLYFVAMGPGGNELWSSDGSAAGTAQVADLTPGPAGTDLDGLTNVNGQLYFRANDSAHGYELWKSNGTRNGTRLVADLVPGAESSYAYPVGSLGGQVLFVAYFINQAGAYDEQLWIGNAPAPGAHRLGTMVLDQATGIRINGNSAFFAVDGATGPEPWVSDGTATGTHLLLDINPSSTSSIAWFEKFGSWTVFKLADPTLGDQLWRTDGSAAGTQLVSNVPADPAATFISTSTRHRLTAGSTFFFTVNDPIAGLELFGYSAEQPPIH